MQWQSRPCCASVKQQGMLLCNVRLFVPMQHLALGPYCSVGIVSPDVAYELHRLCLPRLLHSGIWQSRSSMYDAPTASVISLVLHRLQVSV